MKAKVNIAADQDPAIDPVEMFDQYSGIFPIPFANVYGECNNFHAARFMES